MGRLAALSVAAATVGLVGAQTPPLPTTCSGTPNTATIWAGEPTLVSTVTNGFRYTVNANVTPALTVLHVYGSQYDMGYAYGSLMATEIKTLVPQVWAYMDATINSSLPAWVPADVRDIILQYGLPFALDLTYNLTAPYTPTWHTETLQGLADGAGIDFNTAAQVAMIPELIRAACSIIVAWGPATANGAAAGAPVHLRALDWNTDGPFQQFPVLLNFHPNPGNGVAFSSLTWAGMLGAITAVSSSGMGVGEKVWYGYDGAFSMAGYVWTFLLQDIAQFAQDTDTALSMIATANRTCAIWIGLSDKLNNMGKIVAYSNQLVNIYNDRNFPSYPNHDLFPGLVFLNKNAQPSSNPCMNDLMHAFYGSLDGPSIATYVTSLAQTGDMHIAIYDRGNELMFVSNAGASNAAGVAVPAYTRPFQRFNLTALWSLPPPANSSSTLPRAA